MITGSKHNVASALEDLAFVLYLTTHVLPSSHLCFGSASNRHLLSAISKFNALVSPTEAITVESVLSSPLSKHALCKKLDDHFFQSTLMTSSLANKA